MSIRIVDGHGAERIADARSLLLEYASTLNFELCFQNFQSELDGLPGAYAPPRGRLLLAVEGDSAGGCVAMRALEPSVCEMKRLYVQSAFRGRGVGRMLVESILAAAAEVGYQRMRLDTVPAMRSAIELYRSVGFREIPPYCHNPVEGAVFLELDLITRQARH